jgi:release factor glutamine methyltransferase
MKIAGNKIIHLKNYYLKELSPAFDEAEIEAQFTLASEHYLGIPKNELNFKLEENINQSDLLYLYDCCKAIKKNIPIQYILEKAHFFGLEFYVNHSVLIPRPETEELVDLILKSKIDFRHALDIGTGSGCIAIALKKNKPLSLVSAIDISAEALMVAKKNAEANKTTVHFFEGDILSEINPINGHEFQFDLIVSNPPYILDEEKNQLAAHVLNQEPHTALFVKGKDPILFYRKIIEYCQHHLKAKGELFFELNPLTSEDVYQCAIESGYFSSVELLKDMFGKIRFLKAVKKV